MARAGFFSVESLKGMHVLVANDDTMARGLLTAVLSYCGALVLTAETAEQTIATMRLIKPDALVAKLTLPDYDAFWLLRQVRTLKPEAGGEVPCVAIGDRAEDRARCLAAGFQAYFAWPLNPWEFGRTIASLTITA
jgi:DNA-binding response OmpR family regulator